MFEWLALVTLTAAAFATGDVDAQALLQSADAPRTALDGQRVAIHATLEAGGHARAVSDLELFIGRNDEALVVFLDRKARKRMYLVRDHDTFLIVPGARHAVRIPPAQRLFGAASFAELARLRLHRDYTASIPDRRAPCGEQFCREIEISARAKGAPYASGTLRLDDQGRIREAEFRLASGKPSKAIVFEYRLDTRGRSVPSHAVITDLLQSPDASVTTLAYGMPEPVADDPARFDPERLLRTE